MSTRPLVPAREGFARGRGDARLYYRAEGQGPALLCSNGVGVGTFFWGPLARELSDRFTVIRWDYRGHGLSDDLVDPTQASITQSAEDGIAVLDALGVDKAVLLGHSMGSQVGFELHRLAPSRVSGLVPTLGTYRKAVQTFFGTALSLYGFEVMRQVIPRAYRPLQKGLAKVMRAPFMDFGARMSGMVHAELCPPEALVPYFAHNARLDLRMYLALVESMQRHDATAELPGIAVPTLVVAGDRDQLTPLACAQEMARLIPGAELFVIPDGTHAALVEQPLLLALRVRQFLEERVAS